MICPACYVCGAILTDFPAELCMDCASAQTQSLIGRDMTPDAKNLLCDSIAAKAGVDVKVVFA